MDTVTATNKPTSSFIFDWDRALDPFHEDAFPDHIKHAGTKGKRRTDWIGVDYWGTPITFSPDTFIDCDGEHEHFGQAHSEMDEEITYHKLHCINCDNHLTSLMLCPKCGVRYQ